MRLPLYPSSPASRAEQAGPLLDLTINGQPAQVREGATLLQACQALGIAVPTLCWAPNLTPVNVCRLCVVELQGARTLVPACSRRAEAGMVIFTDSERVRMSRRLVLELLASSVDLSTAPELQAHLQSYGADGARFGVEAQRVDARPAAERVQIDNELYVRDYGKCVLCYKCVSACGTDAQHTFAIAVAGRGFDATISTEYEVPLPDSACVYCGNCIGVCPTGALMFKSEHDLRAAGAWDESRQTRTDTICPYCGVGCTVTLHVQDERIVKASSPWDAEVTGGHLCIKGRFGWRFVQPG